MYFCATRYCIRYEFNNCEVSSFEWVFSTECIGCWAEVTDADETTDGSINVLLLLAPLAIYGNCWFAVNNGSEPAIGPLLKNCGLVFPDGCWNKNKLIKFNSETLTLSVIWNKSNNVQKY